MPALTTSRRVWSEILHARGKAITKESIQAFIETLELPEDEKARLRTMTPGNYIGKAVELAQRIGK